MPTMVSSGRELICISQKDAHHLDYSTNDGRTWTPRFTGTTYGDFLTLVNGGKELLAQTSKGLYYSTNEGRTWIKRP